MRLVTFSQGKTRIGVQVDGAQGPIADLAAHEPGLPTDMTAFLRAGPEALSRAEDAARTAVAHGRTIPLAAVRLEAAVPHPPKILAVGLNYMDHVRETGRDIPGFPMIFNKQSTSANGPYDPILLPPESEQLDYEGEMAIVIGRRCRRVPANRAHEVIAGYTIINDVSVRDWQLRTPTQTMGKSWDSHCPMGPAIVTADEVADPHALELRTLVNGEERQHSNTEHLIFNCFTLVEHLSTAFTLEPGDVIPTGTCSGVAAMRPGQPWLKDGDTVRVEIEKLGHIENRVAKDPGGIIII